MAADVDFYFVGRRRGRSKADRRLDGYFIIPSQNFACRACSGSARLAPLPAGAYLATNLRKRTDVAMVRDGVGFSVDLSDKYDPALKRRRSLLRIHPDGNAPGTQGCVGILDRVKECCDALERAMEGGGARKLEVVVASSAAEMSICTSHGCFLFA